MTKIAARAHAGELERAISFTESYIAHTFRRLETLPPTGRDGERAEMEGTIHASFSRVQDNRQLLNTLIHLIAVAPNDGDDV